MTLHSKCVASNNIVKVTMFTRLAHFVGFLFFVLLFSNRTAYTFIYVFIPWKPDLYLNAMSRVDFYSIFPYVKSSSWIHKIGAVFFHRLLFSSFSIRFTAIAHSVCFLFQMIQFTWFFFHSKPSNRMKIALTKNNKPFSLCVISFMLRISVNIIKFTVDSETHSVYKEEKFSKIKDYLVSYNIEGRYTYTWCSISFIYYQNACVCVWVWPCCKWKPNAENNGKKLKRNNDYSVDDHEDLWLCIIWEYLSILLQWNKMECEFLLIIINNEQVSS